MLSFMRAIASAANFGGQFTLHRSGSPHVLDSLSWPVLMTKSAESKVRFLEVRLCQRAFVGEGLESAVYDVLSSLNGILQKESNSIHLLLDGFGAVKEEGSTWDFLLGPRGRYERKALEQDWDTEDFLSSCTDVMDSLQ